VCDSCAVLRPTSLAAAVTGLDMCVRQPLIATCGLDRSIHLWNYVDRTCELTKTFAEEAYSIAIHPTGLQVGRHYDNRTLWTTLAKVDLFSRMVLCGACFASQGGFMSRYACTLAV